MTFTDPYEHLPLTLELPTGLELGSVLAVEALPHLDFELTLRDFLHSSLFTLTTINETTRLIDDYGLPVVGGETGWVRRDQKFLLLVGVTAADQLSLKLNGELLAKIALYGLFCGPRGGTACEMRAAGGALCGNPTCNGQ